MRSVNEKMIEEANRFIRKHKRRKVSVRTLLRYMQTGRQLFGKHRQIYDTTSARTYYLRKAALSYYASEQLYEAAKTLDC